MQQNLSNWQPEIFACAPHSPDAPMTSEQDALLTELSRDANVDRLDNLTQLEAHERIIALQDFLATDGPARWRRHDDRRG